MTQHGFGLLSENEATNIVFFSQSIGANGVFAATILDLAKRKPYLIFKDSEPYVI